MRGSRHSAIFSLDIAQSWLARYLDIQAREILLLSQIILIFSPKYIDRTSESRQNLFLISSAYIEAAVTCNTAMEREFCTLFGNIFKNCEKSSYEAKWACFWQVVQFANKPITKDSFLRTLREVAPEMELFLENHLKFL